MKKLRIRLAVFLLAGVALITGCAENENIPITNLPIIRSESSAGSPSSSRSTIFSDSSNSTISSISNASSALSEPNSLTSAPASSRSASTPASSKPVSTPPASSGSASMAHSSVTPVSTIPADPKPASSSSIPIKASGCGEGVHNLVIDSGVVPSCKRSGLSCGVHCAVCGEVVSRQDELSKVHCFRTTDVTVPADGKDGTLSCVCTGCGYPFECTYSAELTEQYVYDALVSMKTVYPEGKPFDNDTKYVTNDLIPNVRFTGRGCSAFAAELSDKAFGCLPGRYHFDFTKIRVGDIVRTSDNSHSVIVLKVDGNVLTVAEGNLNGAVHWGRTLDLSDATVGWSYVLTRYPE